MIKKTVKYTDYNGVEVKEDFFFHLNKAELTEMRFSNGGDYASMVQKAVDTKNPQELIEIFKEFLQKSYGEKSADGKFYKTDENGRPLIRNLISSAAYEKIYMELGTDDKAAAEFINGVVPSDMAEAVRRSSDRHSRSFRSTCAVLLLSRL